MQRGMELFRLLAMLLAVGCLIVSALGVGGAFDYRLDIVNHFAPLTLALSIVAAAIQIAFGKSKERPTLACAVCAVVLSAGVMTPELIAKATQRRTAPRGQTIKVIEMNLWSLNRDVPGTVRWLAAQRADVLVLEEVVDHTSAVPEMLKAAYPHHNACEPDTPCTTLIFSRALPTASGAYPAPDGAGLHSAAWATFGAGDKAFTVIGDHAPWPRAKDRQQVQSALLASRMSVFDRRSLIVAGDFNSTPWSFSLRRQDALFGLERRTRALFTFPVHTYSRYRFRTPFPVFPIDQIYAGSAWKTVSVTRGPRLGSDHLATIAILTR
jgi:endonuclease/exonuclease/phosphatase (EEP) superfamily protein YafD